MVEVNDALILKLESLARLQLSDEARKVVKKDMIAVLQMIEKLEEVDTTDIEPLAHMTEAQLQFRRDLVKNQLSEEEALLNAPAKQPPYFQVPKVISR